MSTAQYMGLIAALFWVGSCSNDAPGKSALSEWAAVALAVLAITIAIVHALT